MQRNNQNRFSKFGMMKKKVEFRTVRSMNFHTNNEQAYQAILIYKDDEPMIGLQKMWFEQKSGEWKYTSKCLYMPLDAWKDFANQFGQIDETLTSLIEDVPPKKVQKCSPPEIGAPSSSSSKSDKQCIFL